MSSPRLNYLIDILMVVSFIITAFTGAVIFFFLPSGVRQGGYQEFLGVVKGTWTTWHNWAGIIMITLVLFHLILHLNWIVCMTSSLFKKGGDKDGKQKRNL